MNRVNQRERGPSNVKTKREANMGIIRVTYEIVTPESAEDGEVAERGWVDEKGTEYDVDEAIRKLVGCEPSSWPSWHPGVWYTDADGDTDYLTGAETRRSYHLSGFTPEEEQRIYAEVALCRV